MKMRFTINSLLMLTATLIFSIGTAKAQFWLPVGPGVNNNVYSLTKDTVNNELYAGGRFTDAGGTQSYRVAKWNGSVWSSLGNGFDSDVYALYYDHSTSTLYAGGNFTFTGTNAVNRIAKWDGANWIALGSGCNDQVLSLTGDGSGNIIAGGFFTTAGSVNAARVAKWNGTAWSALGSGIGSGSNYVEALTYYNGDVIAGGQFSTAGGNPATGVARWDGTSWHDLSGGVNGLSVRVSAFTIVNGELFCGGTFSQAGGFPANSLAKWNGIAWSAVGGGITGGQAKVKSLGYLFNVLYVGGNFSQANGTSVSNIAAYDGTSWSDLSGGANNQVDVLINFNNEMFAGGAFNMMGGNSMPFISRYHTTCVTTSTISSLPASCYMQCNGSATVNASGFAPFTYQWSTNPVQTSATATGLCEGTYSVIITDSTGCSITNSVNVTQPDSLVLTFITTNPGCSGSCNGTATALNNGQGNVIYSWNTIPAQNVQTATNLCAGTFTVEITDSAGCIATDSVIINEPAVNVVSITAIPPTCFNACNGQAIAQSTGTAPFQFVWNTIPPQNSDIATGLCAGVYTVTVMDSLGCSAVDSIEIINPSPATLQFATTTVSCHNLCDATATVTSTGVAPFTYTWNSVPAQNSATATSLCAGVYLVTVTDSIGCSVTDSVTIGQPDSLMISFNTTNLTCHGVCNGSALAGVVNAQGSVSYIWNNDSAMTSNIIVNLCAGTYTVQVTDSMGCVTTDSATILEPAANVVSLTALNTTCYNSCDGKAIATSTGTAPFTFVWNTIPPQNTDTAIGMCSGVYIVTVTDSLGCNAVDSIEITSPQQPALQFTTTSATCFGSCNATAMVTSSGPAPYSYIWSTSPVQTDSVATNLCAGTYLVTVTDGNLCQVTDSVTIDETLQNQLSFTTVNARCAIACNGTASVSSTGVSPFSYLWGDGSTTSDIDSLCAGTYTVTVTDNIGCSVTNSVIIINAPLQIVFTTQFSACNGACTGEAAADISGLTGLLYNWSTGSTNSAIDSLCPGFYAVTITDDLGCVSTDSVEIKIQPVNLNLAYTSPTCNSLCNGSASINPSGTPPYQWLWSNGDTASLSLTNLCAGAYSVSITDSAGCSGNGSFVLTDPPAISFNATFTDATCAGLCNGQSTIIATGGSGTFSYLWNTTPAQTDSSATGLCFGYTSFVITDSNNCSVTDSVLIFEPFPITIGSNILPVSCTGDCDGFLRAIPSGGTPAYTYEWSTGTTFDSVLNACAGSYTVTVTDANQCTATQSYTLIDPSPLTITFNVTNASCSGCNDGAIIATASGGTPPYDYLYPSLSLFDSVATNLTSGYYQLCVQDLHNCLQCDSVFVDITSGINVLSSAIKDIGIYPNPFTDYAYIKINSTTTIYPLLKFYDVSGREVYIASHQVSSADNKLLYRIDNNNLIPGLYYVKIFSGKEVIGVGKFIIH